MSWNAVVDPPYFTLRPKPVYQCEPEQKVEMPCMADGDPRPVISWRKVSATCPACFIRARITFSYLYGNRRPNRSV